MELRIQNQQLVILTAITIDAFESAKKLAPQALIAKDDKDQAKYAVTYSDVVGKGDITDFSLTANAVVGGKLALVLPLPRLESEDAARDYVTNSVGTKLATFNHYEQQIVNQISAAVTEVSEVLSTLTMEV